MVSVIGGVDQVIKAPEFVVKGATDFDQRWIDETTEAGIAGLGWKRPEARPPEWDKPLSRNPKATIVDPADPAPAAKPAKKKRAKWLDMLRGKKAGT